MRLQTLSSIWAILHLKLRGAKDADIGMRFVVARITQSGWWRCWYSWEVEMSFFKKKHLNDDDIALITIRTAGLVRALEKHRGITEATAGFEKMLRHALKECDVKQSEENFNACKPMAMALAFDSTGFTERMYQQQARKDMSITRQDIQEAVIIFQKTVENYRKAFP